MWRSSLISRRVLFASILLSKALAIFLIATYSFVSEFKAELKREIKQRTKINQNYETNNEKGTPELEFYYHTMPYAPFPMGMIGGLYLEVTSKTFPKMLYWINRPPWLSVAGMCSVGCWPGYRGGAASDIAVSTG